MYNNKFWLNIVKRELAIHAACRNEWLAIILFYVITVSLFPIAIGPLPSEVTWVAPIFIWVAALLATVLAQETVFRADYNSGIFEQILASRIPFASALVIKILIHWLVFAFPLLLVTPFLALSFNLPPVSIIFICISLGLGTLVLHLLGAIGAALTVSLAQGGLFLALLLLPLYTPVLVLGSAIGILSVQGVISSGHIALLMALAIIALVGAPLTVAAAIKVNLE